LPRRRNAKPESDQVAVYGKREGETAGKRRKLNGPPTYARRGHGSCLLSMCRVLCIIPMPTLGILAM